MALQAPSTFTQSEMPNPRRWATKTWRGNWYLKSLVSYSEHAKNWVTSFLNEDFCSWKMVKKNRPQNHHHQARKTLQGYASHLHIVLAFITSRFNLQPKYEYKRFKETWKFKLIFTSSKVGLPSWLLKMSRIRCFNSSLECEMREVFIDYWDVHGS